MSNIPESNTWEAVRQWETNDPALGGASDTLFTTPVKNLTNRTKYLKTLADNIVSGVQAIIGNLNAGSTCANNYTDYEDSSTAVATTQFVASAIALKGGRRNALLNGAMEISQRGDGFTLGAGENTYTLDRWWAKCAANSGDTIRIIRDNALLQGLFDGFKYCMKINFNSGSTSLELRQRIVNGRTFEGQKATLQMMLYLTNNCNVTVTLRRYLNQDEMDADTPEWSTSAVISGTVGLHRYANTFTVPAIGSNVNMNLDDDGCLEVSINISHAAGASLVAGLTNVQIESGAHAGNFEMRDDLAECLTYYERTKIYERYDRSITADGGAGIPAFYTRQYYGGKRKTPRLSVDNETLVNVSSYDLTNVGKNACTLKWQPSTTTQVVTYREVDMDLNVDAEIEI